MSTVIGDRLLASPGRVAMTRVLAGGLTLLVASAAFAVGSDLYGWEERVTGWAVDLPEAATSWLRVVMQAGNRLAVAAVALVFLVADRPRRAAIALISGWGAWFAAVILKLVIGRPRPSADVLGFSPEEFVTGNGYPSSHAAIAVALALVVVTAVDVPRALKAVAVAAAVLTAVARVHLVVHWPLDILGGVAIGLVVAGLVIVALDPAPVPAAWPGVGRWPPAPDPVTPPALVGASDPADPLRVATFNIRNGWALDGVHSWPFRRRATAATLESLEADIVGLQEVYGFQRRWLEGRLGGREWIGAGRGDGLGRGEQCAIAWRPSRLRLEHWGVRWFSDHPEQAGTRLEGAQFPRLVTLAHFRDRQTDVKFGVANAHLDAHSRDHRRISAEMLVRWLAEDDLPWLVIGDLNDDAGSPALAVLESGGYRSVGPDDDRGTVHQFSGRTDGRRIDHVLTSADWSAGPAEIPTDSSNRLPSDHWPLVVDVWTGAIDEQGPGAPAGPAHD